MEGARKKTVGKMQGKGGKEKDTKKSVDFTEKYKDILKQKEKEREEQKEISKELYLRGTFEADQSLLQFDSYDDYAASFIEERDMNLTDQEARLMVCKLQRCPIKEDDFYRRREKVLKFLTPAMTFGEVSTSKEANGGKVTKAAEKAQKKK